MSNAGAAIYHVKIIYYFIQKAIDKPSPLCYNVGIGQSHSIAKHRTAAGAAL